MAKAILWKPNTPSSFLAAFPNPQKQEHQYKVRKESLMNFKESGAWFSVAFEKHMLKIKHIAKGHWLPQKLFMGLSYVLIWELELK